MKILYLRWLDSALAHTWTVVPSKYTGLAMIETVGYLVAEDEMKIQVAQSTDKVDGTCSAILSIPKSVILERRVMPMPKSKKRRR